VRLTEGRGGATADEFLTQASFGGAFISCKRYTDGKENSSGASPVVAGAWASIEARGSVGRKDKFPLGIFEILNGREIDEDC